MIFPIIPSTCTWQKIEKVLYLPSRAVIDPFQSRKWSHQRMFVPSSSAVVQEDGFAPTILGSCHRFGEHHAQSRLCLLRRSWLFHNQRMEDQPSRFSLLLYRYPDRKRSWSILTPVCRHLVPYEKRFWHAWLNKREDLNSTEWLPRSRVLSSSKYLRRSPLTSGASWYSCLLLLVPCITRKKRTRLSRFQEITRRTSFSETLNMRPRFVLPSSNKV
jgi:hypothetical protein